LAIVTESLDDLAAKTTAARNHQEAPGVYRPDGLDAAGIAFLVPPAASARIGMTADILTAFPHLRQVAETGRQWLAAMLPPQTFGDDHHQQQAALTEAAGPATAIASLTLARALATHGVTPARVAGWNTPLLAPRGSADALQESLVATSLGEPMPAVAPPADVEDDGDDPEALILDEIRELSAEGINVFVEVGPGDTLTGLVDRALPDTPHLAVAADRPGYHGLTSLLHALAQLAVAGVPVDLAALHTGRGSDPERWNDPPRRPGWIVNGYCARVATGESLPKGLRPADEAPTIRLADREPPPSGPPPASPLTEGEVAVVSEYLRVVEAMIATGDAIVQGHAATNGQS
jgi:hypothetical protein